jgi:DNA-binding MarR family transcriptional regulator
MAADPVEQLRREALVLLRECAGAMEGLSSRFAAAAAVHPTDLHALDHLSRRRDQPITVGELGAALDLSSAAVTGLVDRLVESGHVERVGDPADRRRVRVRMTEQAHQLAAEVFGSYARRLDAAMRGFDAGDLRTIATFLRAATEAAEDRARP